jgi:hypothetical protein
VRPYNKKVILLLLATLAVRILTVFIIGKTPCMDPSYLWQANNIINSPGKVAIYITPSYGFLLYFLDIFTKSIYLSSSILYIIFSFGDVLISYLISRELFSEKAGKIVIILMLFFPNVTVAVAGYSHTSIVSSFFILLSIYALIRFTQSRSNYLSAAILFSLAIIIGTYIRPESLVISVALSLLIFLKNGQQRTQKIYFLLLSYFIITTGVFLHGAFIKHKSSSSYASTFSDAKYTYITYVCVFSDVNQGLKPSSGNMHTSSGAAYSDSLSLALSAEAFGTPESNHWSILRAIEKNPKVALMHFFFITKQCLFCFAHPLLCPFYIYLMAGIGLFFLLIQKRANTLILLGFLFFLSMVPVLFTHAEIRYLTNCVYPIILLSAWGIAQFESKRLNTAVIISVSTANFIIYMIYIINNAHLESLCG